MVAVLLLAHFEGKRAFTLIWGTRVMVAILALLLLSRLSTC